jgi:transcriptional regulator with GAF, ATPase, and Fis domain
MKDVEKYKSKKLEGPEILIIIMMTIVGIIGILVGEIEVKLICAILFVIGGFILFMSISNKGKELFQEEKFHSGRLEEKDSKSIENLAMPNANHNVQPKKFKTGDSKNIKGEDDFFIVKPIPNNKKSSRSDKYLKSDFHTHIQPASSILFNVELNKFSDGKDPKLEFSVLLNDILNIIKQVTFAHTVSFFWINLDTNQSIFESSVTNSIQFSLKRKDTSSLNDSLIGRVAKSKQTEIITQVNSDAEKDLLGYYSSNEYIKSVLGMPILFNNSVISILTIDSKEEDAFGEETVEQLSHFVTLITNFIEVSTEKYDYFIDSKILNKVELIHQDLKGDFDLSNLIQYFLKLISEFFIWDFVTFSYFDFSLGEWKVYKVLKKVESQDYINENAVIDLSNSIVGRVIKENKFAVIEDLSQLNLARFRKSEEFDCFGSFIAMPICSYSKVYGAISLEKSKNNYYSFDDAGILKKICNIIANYLEIACLKDYIKDRITLDEITNISKKESFCNQIHIMLDWIKDYNDFGSFILFSIDKVDELKNRHGISGFNKVLVSVVQVINSNLESYNLLGKLNDNIIGLFLMRYSLDEGKVFAEKIRKNIANNIIYFENRSFSVTVTSVVKEVKRYLSTNELIDSSLKVLQLTLQEGGNRVKIL